MPRIDATDRSISPLMMISVIGSVMIAISPLDRPRLNRLFPVRNCDDADDPMMAISTSTMARPVSQRTAGRSLSVSRSRPARLLMARPLQPQGAGEPPWTRPSRGDGDNEQQAPDR